MNKFIYEWTQYGEQGVHQGVPESRSERWRRFRLWRRRRGESLSQWGGLRRRRARAAPPSKWGRLSDSGRGDGDDWGGLRRLTVGRGEWLPWRPVEGDSGLQRITAGCCEWLGLRRVRRAVESDSDGRRAAANYPSWASEPGWPLRVTAGRAAARWVTQVTVSYTGCASRREWLGQWRRQSDGGPLRVTRAAASDGGPQRVFLERALCKIARKPLQQCKTSVFRVFRADGLPLATPGTLAAAKHCRKQRQHLLLQGLHPSRVGHQWCSGGRQVGEDSTGAAGADHGCWRPWHGLRA